MEQQDLIDKALLDTMTNAVKAVLKQRGVENNSKLMNSIEFVEVEGAFVLLANDYYEYLSTGRKPKARKVPITDLIEWIKRNTITPKAGQSINQLAFAIQTSIYKNGIKGKSYIDPVTEVSLDIAEEGVSDILEEGVLDMLQNSFKI